MVAPDALTQIERVAIERRALSTVVRLSLTGQALRIARFIFLINFHRIRRFIGLGVYYIGDLYSGANSNQQIGWATILLENLFFHIFFTQTVGRIARLVVVCRTGTVGELSRVVLRLGAEALVASR